MIRKNTLPLVFGCFLITPMILQGQRGTHFTGATHTTDIWESKTLRFGCPDTPEGLCIFPTNDLAIIFQDCSTGTIGGGVPPTHFNIPPGQSFRFSLVSPPESQFGTFAIVSEAVANGMGSSPCVGGPGVFVGPIPVDSNTNPNFLIHEVSSAVVDQMIDQVNLDGFVVMLAMDCDYGLQLFSGLDFTRDPPEGSTDLSLNLVNGPTQINLNEPFSVDFSLANNGDDPAENPIVSFDLPLGSQWSSGSINGQPCQEFNNQVTCPVDTLNPGQVVEGTFTASAQLAGKTPFDMNLNSDTCDANQTDNQLFLNPFAFPAQEDQISFGFGSDGGGFSTEIWVSNPTLAPAPVTIWTTTPECTASPLPLGGDGFVEMTVPPGETLSFASLGTQSQKTPYLWWFLFEGMVVPVELRQIDTNQLPQKTLGTTDPSLDDADISSFDDDYPIPFFDIVTGANQKIYLVNLTDTEQNTTGQVRDAVDGTVTTEFTTTLQPFQIQTFPLDQQGLPGTNPHGFWKSGGQGVLAVLEFNTSDLFDLVFPGIVPPDSGPLAQPLFRPDPTAMEYDPSELNMALVKQNGNSLPAGRVDFSYDNDCGPLASSETSELFDARNPNVPIFLPIDIDDQLGGFSGDLPPETVSTLKWREGNGQVLVKACPPSNQGLIRLPKDRAATDPAATKAQVRFMIRSEADIKMPIAVFDEGGAYRDFRFLDVPAGSHLYCREDVTLDDELDFLEFQVPPESTGNVWFFAIADEPDLEYKDALPTHVIPEDSRVNNFKKILDAWNGDGGTSCLGDAPDVLDIVSFMNDGLKCP